VALKLLYIKDKKPIFREDKKMKTEKTEDIKKTVKETEKLFKHFNFGNLYGSGSKEEKHKIPKT